MHARKVVCSAFYIFRNVDRDFVWGWQVCCRSRPVLRLLQWLTCDAKHLVESGLCENVGAGTCGKCQTRPSHLNPSTRGSATANDRGHAACPLKHHAESVLAPPLGPLSTKTVGTREPPAGVNTAAAGAGPASAAGLASKLRHTKRTPGRSALDQPRCCKPYGRAAQMIR